MLQRLKSIHFSNVLFLMVVAISFYALGVSLYNINIYSENSFALETTDISGNYIVSLEALNTSRRITPNGSSGRVPLSQNESINDAQKISNSLNELDGVKAMPVGCKNTPYVIVINQEKSKINSDLFRVKKSSDVEKYLSKQKYKSSIYDKKISDYNPDFIYAIDSELLLSFYENNCYDFFYTTGKGGIFLSEALANELEITEENEYVTMIVSTSQNGSYNPISIEVPISGIFRIREGKYITPKKQEKKNVLTYDSEAKFVFLDISYFKELFSYETPEVISFDSVNNFNDALNLIKGSRKNTTNPICFQNIWVRGGDKDLIESVVSSFDSSLVVDDSFSSSVVLSRTYEITKTISRLAFYYLIFTVILILFVFSFAYSRLLDYKEKEIQLRYYMGMKRNQVTSSLFISICPFIILISFLSYIYGLFRIYKFASSDYQMIPLSVVLIKTIIFYFVMLSISILTTYFTTYLFVKKTTLGKYKAECRK